MRDASQYTGNTQRLFHAALGGYLRLTPGNVRMTDVAKHAGVSTMTVSRVLNENPRVTDGLRIKVFAAIRELRYQPNELARSLREQRSRQIGIIVPYLYDPFFAICADAVSNVAKQHSYSIVLATSNEDPNTEFEEANRMLRRNVEGLIVIPAHFNVPQSLLLASDFRRMPIVSLDRPIEGSPYDSLLVDNEGGGRMGTKHLLDLGHKRVVYLGFWDNLYTMRMRHRGYDQAMRAAGLEPRSAILSGSLGSSIATLGKLLSGRSKPTALFCANNLITRHVLHSLQAMGLHPPSPVALVGFDDFETADLLRPGVTVVRQPNEHLGRAAAECLFRRLEHPDRNQPGVATILPVELIIRGSCGARTEANSDTAGAGI
jgi:LacI family transcriptional regulator